MQLQLPMVGLIVKTNFQNGDFIYAKIKKSRPDLLTRPNRYLFKDMELCHIANQQEIVVIVLELSMPLFCNDDK